MKLVYPVHEYNKKKVVTIGTFVWDQSPLWMWFNAENAKAGLSSGVQYREHMWPTMPHTPPAPRIKYNRSMKLSPTVQNFWSPLNTITPLLLSLRSTVVSDNYAVLKSGSPCNLKCLKPSAFQDKCTLTSFNWKWYAIHSIPPSVHAIQQS